MMKKVSFCHLKSTLMGRNSQRSSEGERTLNRNGDVRVPEHVSLEVDQSDTESLCRTVLKKDEKHSQNKHTNNIFKTIRWKWRKHRRNKNSDISKSWNDPRSKHNCRDDSQESACNFRSSKVNSKHSLTKRGGCPVPSTKNCVKRDANLDYCDIEDESEDRHGVCCVCGTNSPIINSSRSKCHCSSSLESDANSVSLQSIENVGHSNACDELTRTSEGKDQRSASNHPAMVRPQSHISSSHAPSGETASEPTSNSDVTDRINDCSSTALVPSYGTGSTSSSDIHLYESVSEAPQIGSLALELAKLAKCGWYWGPITRGEAEEKLANQPDGAFLVRDSSDDHYLLSLSFRSYTRTFHTRIEHCNGLFSFYSHPEPDGHTSIVELIQQSMNFSQSGAFCYSRSRSPEAPSFPVRLTRPISRFTQVRSLQYLCRFTIRQYTRFDLLQKLPIPSSIKGYLEQRQY